MQKPLDKPLEQRSVYLAMIPLQEALDQVRPHLSRTLCTRTWKESAHASGSVLAAPVRARLSSPGDNLAAMDGISLDARCTFGATEETPKQLHKGRDFAWVNTGNALPKGHDAVVMVEDVQDEGGGTVLLERASFPYQHVRRIGEDIVAGELLFAHHHRLVPADVGALLSAGVYEVEVLEAPLVAVIPTGDEVLDHTDRPEPAPGQVVESNSMMLCAMVEEAGLQARRTPPVADDPQALDAAVRDALASGAQVVVLGAGTSAGSRDFTREVLEGHGTVLVHGIAAMPGKPTLMAVTADGRLLVGAPGYPVSAVVAFREVVLPLARHMGWIDQPDRSVCSVRMARKFPSKPGMEEFVRVAVGRVDDDLVAVPLARGAGTVTSLARAHAVVRIPAAVEGVAAGSEQRAELLRPRTLVERTAVMVGSHDLVLDVLADVCMDAVPHEGDQKDQGEEGDGGLHIASANVGSLGGIRALADGMALCGCAHLFDPESGDFNFPFIERHAPGLELEVVNVVLRQQGLMVAPGNPKGIVDVKDTARDGLRYVNRQRGAGTRVLFDHLLQQAGVSPDAVDGYAREEVTHMTVAAAVASGQVDCGMGIQAAADALGLDFVPLARERYDILIPRRFMHEPRIRILLGVLRSTAFSSRVAAMPGYDVSLTGRVLQPGSGLMG